MQLEQLPPEERDEALKTLVGPQHLCSADCQHDHQSTVSNGPAAHVHGPDCSHSSHQTSTADSTVHGAADETMQAYLQVTAEAQVTAIDPLSAIVTYILPRFVLQCSCTAA